jgi:hypothetical protein
MYFCNLLKGECSPIKVAYHPLNNLFHFRIQNNWRSARPCFTYSSVGRPFVKPFNRSSSINFSLTSCFVVRQPSLLNKTPEAYAPWYIMLFTSCLSFDIAHNKEVEAVLCIAIVIKVRINSRESRRSSAARDSPPYKGGVLHLLQPPFVRSSSPQDVPQ